MSSSDSMSMDPTMTMSDMGMHTSMSTGMSMPMDMPMDMEGMNMVFFSSINTALFSSQWTPQTMGEYAGTCIFLIVLAVAFRGLLAIRSCLEATAWADGHMHGQSLLSSYRPQHDHDTSPDSKAAVDSIRSAWAERPPWRLEVDGWRAVLDTILVGVGYLLMLAVMTMNVGYFASVLAGTFLGSIVLGRFIRAGAGC